MKNNKKKGFTIVELVIVIAVIGILSAVLIPTFSNVTKNAKKELDQELKAIVTTITQVEAGDLTASEYYFSYIMDDKDNENPADDELAWYQIKDGKAVKLENDLEHLVVDKDGTANDIKLSDITAINAANTEKVNHDTEGWEDLNMKVVLYIYTPQA